MDFKTLGFLLAVFVTVSLGQAPPGSNPCTWGPSYWCKAQENAIKCNATEYCNNHAWIVSPATKPPKPISPEAGPLCQICQIVVSYVKPFIDSNSTETEVKAGLEKLCSILPASYKKQCDDFVNDYFDKLWAALKKDVDNGTFCKDMGLCTSVAVTVVKPEAGPFCQLCELVVPFLKPYVDSNSTEAEAKAALEKLCSLLPSTFSNPCTAFVEKNFDALWAEVRKDVDTDTICQALDLCTSSGVEAKKENNVKGLSPLCILCEFIMSKLEKMIVKNSTEAEIEAALGKVCDVLPKTVEKECTEFVNKYGPEVVKLLLDAASPTAVCTLLTLCLGDEVVMVKPVKTVEAGPWCPICEFVMKELYSLIGKNSTEAEIEAALDKVCSFLPSTLKSECTSFVNKYAPEIINLLLNDTSPDAICSLIGLCSSNMVPMAEPIRTIEAGECALCEFVMKEIENLIQQNSTEAEIEAALDKVCSILPSTLKSACDAFVAKYTPDIINLLVQKVDPSQICKDIGLCNSSAIVEHTKQFRGDLECETCELVLKEFDAQMVKTGTEQEVLAALEKECALIPNAKIKEACTSMLVQYGPQIIKSIVSGLDPRAVCSYLKLCTDAQPSKHVPEGGIKWVAINKPLRRF